MKSIETLRELQIRILQKTGELKVASMAEVRQIIKAAREYDNKYGINGANYGYQNIFNEYKIIQKAD